MKRGCRARAELTFQVASRTSAAYRHPDVETIWPYPSATDENVARADRLPTHGGRRLLGVRRALRTRPRAELGRVAERSSGTPRRSRVRQDAGRAVVGAAVAGLGAVAVPPRRPAHGGALRVGRRRATRPGAGLDDIADPRRGPADSGRGLEGARRRAVTQ